MDPGIYVRDLEAQKAWYMAKLGMVVVTAVPKYGEYIMGFGTAPDAAILTLQKSDKRPARPEPEQPRRSSAHPTPRRWPLG